MAAVFGLTPRFFKFATLPLLGFAIGWFLDAKETERMVMFRDKSKLYGGNVKEGQQPTWP
ncbi:uncharacterized protein LOC123294697 isoform X2 [Chrysoperla carnea]|uniref:uncharacterized protein LOC123294697 isoform X2 n=1 Tax=Chrysoperla carnea TaxID=189513 RepID=UPI001D08F5D3|nr:uncharacterized protein LOC123294697 isoform X2 [Chrysoperla carnea]